LEYDIQENKLGSQLRNHEHLSHLKSGPDSSSQEAVESAYNLISIVRKSSSLILDDHNLTKEYFFHVKLIVELRN
ncbi:hypothetical protein, partial [Enterobacter asburiae]|uniref:hypothetical protein n=1 Tax=Enterobacter asburiae TaxID=61645 RepID=UPI001E656439